MDFNKICIIYGCYVRFYNERLDGIKYFLKYEIDLVFIEFCEVIVIGINN